MALGDGFIFGVGGRGGVPTYEELQKRRAIAAQLAARQRRHPTTVGEGLTAIGEAIGDVGYDWNTRRMENESKAYAGAQVSSAPPTETPVYTPQYGSSVVMPPAPATPPPPTTTTPPEVTPSTRGPQSETTPPAVAPPATAPRADSGSNVDSWYQFAIRPADQGGLGLSPQQAAGVVGNLQHESTPRILPTGVVGDAGTAFGAAQWRHDRLANLKNFAAANGQDWRTTEAQQAFMRHEMIGSGAHGGGSERTAYQRLVAAADPSAAATAFNRAYERSADRSGNRERAAAVLFSRYGANAPAVAAAAAAAPVSSDDSQVSPTLLAQDDTLGLLSGRKGDGGEDFTYRPTATLRPAGVVSDAPEVSGVTPQNSQSVIDTVQQGRNAITRTLTQPPPPQPAPGGGGGGAIVSDIRPAPAPGQQLAQAQVPTAPPVPTLREPPPPRLLPMETPSMRHWSNVANDPRIDPTTRAMAAQRVQQEQAQIKTVNDQILTEYNAARKHWTEQNTPATIYSNEKARRDLEGEGAIELTPEQRTRFGVPAGQAAWMTRRGELKLGPAGTNVTVDQRGESEFAKANAKNLAAMFDEYTKNGVTASDDLDAITALRRSGVQSGGWASMTKFLSDYGIKLPGADAVEFYSSMIDRLTPQQRVPGSGTSSDFDGRMFKGSLPRLANTPGGNELIMSTMEAIAENKLRRADVSIRVQTGELSPTDGVRELRRLQAEAKAKSDEVKSFLSQQEKAGTQPSPAPGAVPPAPGPQPQQRQQTAPLPADLPTGKPVGTIVRDPANPSNMFRMGPGGWERVQ